MPLFGSPVKNILALLGLTKYALANIYMTRGERRRVRGSARNSSCASVLAATASATTSVAVSVASDVRTIGILCAIGIRNLLHDARTAAAKERSRD
jgi:hypothetical protein